MKINLFILASFIFIGLVTAFVFYLNVGDYTLTLGNFSLTLPVMLWIGVPLLIYFVLALLHISFYGFLRYLKFKHFFKDATFFESFTQDLLLEKNPKLSFQTKEFKQVAEFAKTIKTHEKIPNKNKLNEILDTLDALKREEYLNLNKFKLASDNILFLQNEKNHLKSNAEYAYSKVKNLIEFKDELEEFAFEQVLKKGSYAQIKNVKVVKNSKQILSIIERLKEGSLELSLAEYEVLLTRSNLNANELLDAAKMSIKLFNPDAILNIFLKIKNENNDALRAYLYLLAEFSMYDELRAEIGTNKKDFEEFEIILLLREHNKTINLERLIC